MSQPETLTARDLQAALADRGVEVTLRTIKRWRAAGCPCRKEDESKRTSPVFYDLEAVIRWLDELGRTGDRGRPAVASDPAAAARAATDGSSPSPPKTADGYTSADLNLMTKRANLAIKELEAEKRRRVEAMEAGRLIDAAEAERAWTQACASVRARLLSIPGGLAGRLADMTDAREIEDELDAAIRAALVDLAEA